MSIKQIIYVLEQSNAILKPFAWIVFSGMFCFICNLIVWVSAIYFSGDTETMKRMGTFVDNLNPQLETLIIWVMLPLVVTIGHIGIVVNLYEAFNSDSGVIQ